jgi:hypothetical protein
MGNFLILGLPRSRTAWLANFMSYDGFFCMHEGINGCISKEEYLEKFKYSNVGDSTTAAMVMQLAGVQLSGVRTLIIDSSIDKAVKYGKDVLRIDAEDILVDTATYLDNYPGLHIPESQINDRLDEIWYYLTDNAPFDDRRAKMLVDLDIQVKQPYGYDELAAHKLMEDLQNVQKTTS